MRSDRHVRSLRSSATRRLVASLVAPLVITVAALASTSSAHAHAALADSVPAANATLDGPPAEVRLHFSEALEPRFCGIEVVDAKGVAATHDQAAVEADVMRLPLHRLAAGAYRVRWTAVARDGHRTKGEFGFTVR